MKAPPVPPPLLTFGLLALPAIVGSCWMRSPTVSLPDFWISARSTVMTGLDVSISTRRMFEPRDGDRVELLAGGVRVLCRSGSDADADPDQRRNSRQTVGAQPLLYRASEQCICHVFFSNEGLPQKTAICRTH